MDTDIKGLNIVTGFDFNLFARCLQMDLCVVTVLTYRVRNNENSQDILLRWWIATQLHLYGSSSHVVSYVWFYGH